jgi:HEAT repeat protein
MTSPPEYLRRFQQTGDVDALLAYAAAVGHEVDEIRAALATIESIFTALTHGEHPNFALLDRTALQTHAIGTIHIVRAMVGSDRADLRSAGFQVIGLLDDPRLMGVLLEALRSKVTWLRLSAIEALGRMSAVHSRSVLEAMTQHEDLVTRRAVAEALAYIDTR